MFDKRAVLNQILKNIRRNLTIKNLLSDTPSRLFIVSGCFIFYRFVVEQQIPNTFWFIFFLTFGVTIHGLSKGKYVKFLESEDE